MELTFDMWFSRWNGRGGVAGSMHTKECMREAWNCALGLRESVKDAPDPIKPLDRREPWMKMEDAMDSRKP